MNKHFLLTYFFIPYMLVAQNANGYLRRQNTQFSNNDGVVVLKGVNIGNWLHIEPYMINAPTAVAGSYESLHAGITSVTGSAAQADAFFTTWRNTFIQKKDIDSIASMGFNHVRVPFPYQLFYNSVTNSYITEGFTYLDNVVNWCKLNNIYAILDLHHAPGGQNDGGLWSNYTNNKEISKQIWKNIAQHFASETAVGGYDILNEPVISVQSEQWKLKDLYQAITSEIRTVDTNHLLIFEGNWYASSFWELTDGTPSSNDRWDDNMALSQHVYWVPQPSNTNFWTNSIANAMDVPKWCGEGGENANHWLNEWVKDCENTNSSWCLWTYKKAGGISSLYSNPYNTNYQAVLDFWNGGIQPSQTNAIAGLLQFAQQSDLSYCTVKKDVKDAIFRPTFNASSIPFKESILPCTLNAVDYDMGANGVGSYDHVYQSVGQGSNFTNYNNGWNYRNDGVDIETWTGSPTIGSIDTNEWLQYTVQVPQAAFYKVSLQYAAPTSGAKVKIQSEGVDIIQEQLLPATNGWASWEFAELGIIPIEAQTDFSLKLFFTNNGLNVKALKFELVDSIHLLNEKLEKDCIQIDCTSNQLCIYSSKKMQEISLFSVTGSLIYTSSKINSNSYVIPYDLYNGFYYLSLLFIDNSVFTERILR